MLTTTTRVKGFYPPNPGIPPNPAIPPIPFIKLEKSGMPPPPIPIDPIISAKIAKKNTPFSVERTISKWSQWKRELTLHFCHICIGHLSTRHCLHHVLHAGHRPPCTTHFLNQPRWRGTLWKENNTDQKCTGIDMRMQMEYTCLHSGDLLPCRHSTRSKARSNGRLHLLGRREPKVRTRERRPI